MIEGELFPSQRAVNSRQDLPVPQSRARTTRGHGATNRWRRTVGPAGDNGPVTVPPLVPLAPPADQTAHAHRIDPGPAPVMVVTDMDGTLLDESGQRVSQR